MKCELCKVEVGNELQLQQHYLVECDRMTSNPGGLTSTDQEEGLEEHEVALGLSLGLHQAALRRGPSDIAGDSGDFSHYDSGHSIAIGGENQEEKGSKVMANIVFRWYKTIPVSSDQVHLLTSYGNGDPVVLTWDSREVHFASKRIAVPIGSHSCQLVVGEDVHELALFSVKPVTQDITLIVKSKADSIKQLTNTMNGDISSAELTAEVDEDISRTLSGEPVRPKVTNDVRTIQRNGVPPSKPLVNGELSSLRDQDVGSEHGSYVSQRSNDSRGSKHSVHSINRNGVGNSLTGGGSGIYPSATSDHELSEIFRTAGRGSFKNDDSSQGTITPGGGVSEMGSLNSIPSSTNSLNHNLLDSEFNFKPREYTRFGGSDSQSEIIRMRRDDHFKLQHSRTRPNSLPDPGNYKEYLSEGFAREQAQRQAAQPLRTTNHASTNISSRNSSNSGSRASLVLTNGAIDNKIDDRKMKELEDTVESLKSLLKEKDRNIKVLEDDLQDVQKTNETLLREREEVVKASKQMNDKQMDELLRDKETLTTEILLLRQELADKSKAEEEINTRHSLEFNPDHPKVLQKRIVDLESQLSDLQEANECAEIQLQKADKELEKYKEENASLKMVNALGVEDLTAENEKLKRMVTELKEYKRNRGHSRVFEDEVSRLRADTRVLRDTNHKLEEENIKLREDFLDLERNHENLKMHIKHDRRKKKSPSSSSSNYKSNQSKIEEYERQRLVDDLKVAQDKVNIATADLAIQPCIKDTDYTSPNGFRNHSVGEGRGLGSQLLPSKFSTAELTGKSAKSPQYSWLDAFDEKHLSPGSDLSDSTAVLTAGWQASTGLTDSYREPSPQEINRSSRSRHRETRKSHEMEDVSTSDSTSVTGMFEQKQNGTLKTKHHRRNLSSDSSTSSFLGDALKDYKAYTDPRIRSRSYDRTARSKQSRGDMVTVPHRTLQDNNSYNTSDLTSSHHARRNRLRSVSPPRSPSPPGFRSVSPRVVATQHNKGTISDQISKGYVLPLRPFAPRTPRDIEVGMKVKFSRPNGRVSQGMVKYIGQLPGRHDSYLGVELDTDEGRHDGTYNGERFFKCRSNRGVFVSFKKVILVWA